MIRAGMHTLTMGMLRKAKTEEAFWKLLDYASVIDRYASQGVSHFELTLDLNLLALEDPDTAPYGGVESIGRSLAAHGASCSVHLPFRGVDLSYPSREVADGYARMLGWVIALTKPLSPMAYVIHPTGDFYKRLKGMPSCSPVVRKAWETVLYGLERTARHGEVRQEELAVENLTHPLALNDYLLAEGGFSACLDVGHIAADASGEGVDIPTALVRFGKRMRAVHLHDVDMKNGKVRDHRALGTGSVNVEEFARRLVNIGYQGYVAMEVSDGLEAAAASACLFQQVLNRSASEVATFGPC